MPRSSFGAKYIYIVIAIILALYVIYSNDTSRLAISSIDKKYFNQKWKDFIGRILFKEDWAGVTLSKKANYGWLRLEGAQNVAHSYGAPGGLGNIKSELRASIKRGFVLIEGDFWRSSDGEVFCYHGPGIPRLNDKPADLTSVDIRNAQIKLNGSSCLISDIVSEIRGGQEIFIILDIKSNFALTGAQIIEEARREGVVSRLIFQIYTPADFATFNIWAESIGMLAGPIVSTYRSHRSIAHIEESIAASGIRAMTLPTDVAHLSKSTTIKRFVHPVLTCAEKARFRSAGFFGFYIPLEAKDC